MGDRFEVGKSYAWADSGPDPFTVLSRSAKMITVTNGGNTWRMLLRYDERGEYVRDSSMGEKRNDPCPIFMSRPQWEDPTWKL